MVTSVKKNSITEVKFFLSASQCDLMGMNGVHRTESFPLCNHSVRVLKWERKKDMEKTKNALFFLRNVE